MTILDFFGKLQKWKILTIFWISKMGQNLSCSDHVPAHILSFCMVTDASDCGYLFRTLKSGVQNRAQNVPKRVIFPTRASTRARDSILGYHILDLRTRIPSPGTPPRPQGSEVPERGGAIPLVGWSKGFAP